MVRTPFGAFEVRVAHRLTPSTEERAEEIWSSARARVMAHDPDAVAGACRRYGELFGASPAVTGTPSDHHLLDQICRRLGDALRSGRLVVEPLPEPRVRLVHRIPPPPPPEPTPEPEPVETWFEVKVVDELGEVVDGLSLAFRVTGSSYPTTTDGSGVGHVDVESSSSAGSVNFVNTESVRQKMYARWKQPRGKEWREGPPEEEVLQVRAKEILPSVSLEEEKPRTIVLQPRVVLAKLLGIWFDTSKCFLLPTARPTLPRLNAIYDKNQNTNLLIVGHTDRAGNPSYNDPLSLERAKSILAYLTNDVESWYAWYGSSKPQDKRWGSHEDALMIAALGCPEGVDPVRWYQEKKGLKVDGEAGSKTRHALIRDYMDLDGTTLPASIKPSVHGCGENHPMVETEDGEREQANRRVELFFFDSPILPEAPGTNSKPGSLEYPEWVLRAKETYEFDPDDHGTFDIRLHDAGRVTMTDVPYRISLNGSELTSGTSSDGWVSLDLPPDASGTVDCEWGEKAEDGSYPFTLDLRIAHDQGSEREQAEARLHNLGYFLESDEDYEAAVRDFQSDYQIAEEGLEGGELPSMTKSKLWLIYETDCDAKTGKDASDSATDGSGDDADEEDSDEADSGEDMASGGESGDGETEDGSGGPAAEASVPGAGGESELVEV